MPLRQWLFFNDLLQLGLTIDKTLQVPREALRSCQEPDCIVLNFL